MFYDEHVDHSPDDGGRCGVARDLACDVGPLHKQRHFLCERLGIFGARVARQFADDGTHRVLVRRGGLMGQVVW